MPQALTCEINVATCHADFSTNHSLCTTHHYMSLYHVNWWHFARVDSHVAAKRSTNNSVTGLLTATETRVEGVKEP